MLEKGLVVFAYPPKSSEQEEKESPPVSVCLKLPDYVAFFKTPHVARWDAAGKGIHCTSHRKKKVNWFIRELERNVELAGT